MVQFLRTKSSLVNESNKNFLVFQCIYTNNRTSLSKSYDATLLLTIVYDRVLRHFAGNVRDNSETVRMPYECGRAARKDRTDFERAIFRDNFIPCPLSRLSVTTWRTIRFPCSRRMRVARCFLRGPPFVAWANVFYSIKQTRYLVGKLVRTQRCDVGP